MQSVLDGFDRFHEKYLTNRGNQWATSELMATPLTDVHFRTGLDYDYAGGGSNILYIYIVATVAVFLLLTAAINYMNMATAASAKRAKEIGLRKVMGAYRDQLIRQFLTESTVISLLAMVVSVLAAEALLPQFNQLSGKQLTLLTSGNLFLFAGILVMSITVGLVAGSYPAFYLSRFAPARILEHSTKSGHGGGILRRILVVTQFTISITMIIGTILLFQQLNYLKDRDLGFDEDDILAIPVKDEMLRSSLGAFKQELLRSPVILKAAVSSAIPGATVGRLHCTAEERGEMTKQTFDSFYADYDFLDLMGIDIVNGRNFDRSMATDEDQGCIVNESLVKRMDWEDDPLGKRIEYGAAKPGGGWTQKEAHVIGVVRDFCVGSLHSRIPPVVILLTTPPHSFRYATTRVSLRVAPGRKNDALDFIDQTAEEFDIHYPLWPDSLAWQLSQYYRQEETASRIFAYASIVCIVLSFLGLLGLSSFMTEQRTKEIGIRKVLGASVPNLVSLLSENFVRLAGIANLLAWPLAYYAVAKWLEDYPYRIDIGLPAFLAAGILSTAVTLLAVGFQAFKTASANPIRSLRAE